MASGFAQRIRRVNDRRDAAGLNQFPSELQVVATWLCGKRTHGLADEQRQRDSLDAPVGGPDEATWHGHPPTMRAMCLTWDRSWLASHRA